MNNENVLGPAAFHEYLVVGNQFGGDIGGRRHSSNFWVQVTTVAINGDDRRFDKIKSQINHGSAFISEKGGKG
jgi:hypothetical protein